ncbi:hypothetical protein NEUTE1DRAFT_40599 [Neurospora tetrasperma FGSC 2508]|uniref:Calcineurin-like phosphoesterase domain-containing protein n=1 Tax=Neurospora tetrasperma (strain FGSC 2508 / ATCC MYA-4615 / P0657) TaxID=510951 RepID=F8MFB9_NEUT8|nr:uncharacterized protein NEUTE1DRAFT_40599 [Neurospora tetrasperma FGSC 2508]EGO59178.1 hypothetical protein NEUTE1DRAFT_40599 [Neurospora tetrasperma FGSC 2508]EGZ73289.1 Metallo-dependent phosphatase [Neurospora tetrasperma FGSC 2509]
MGITAILQRLHLLRSSEWDPPTPLDHLLTDMQSWPLSIIPIHLHFLRLVVTHLYHLFLFLRGHAFHPPSNIPPIRVVCISDTHNYELDLARIPDGEGGLLIHAGDLTDDGSRESIQRQLDWLGEVRRRKGFERVLVVAGNHDGFLDKEGARQVLFGEGSKGDGELTWPEGVQYLDGMVGEGENGGVMTIEFEGRAKGRKLNVWGWGGVPRCGGPEHAFQYDRAAHPWTNRIPVETDILITHTPPRHHLDLGLGCAGLLAELWRVKPKLHVFGHVHWGAGREAVYYDECQRAYESLMARGADVPFPPAFPSIFSVWMDSMDAARVIWHGTTAVVWKWVMQGPGSNNGALLVNASVTYGNTGKVINPVQVVEL